MQNRGRYAFMWELPHKLKDLDPEKLEQEKETDRCYGKNRVYISRVNGMPSIRYCDATHYLYLYHNCMDPKPLGIEQTDEEWLARMRKAATRLLRGARLGNLCTLAIAGWAFYYGDSLFAQDKDRGLEYLELGVEHRSSTCTLILATIYKEQGKDFKGVLQKLESISMQIDYGLVYLSDFESFVPTRVFHYAWCDGIDSFGDLMATDPSCMATLSKWLLSREYKRIGESGIPNAQTFLDAATQWGRLSGYFMAQAFQASGKEVVESDWKIEPEEIFSNMEQTPPRYVNPYK